MYCIGFVRSQETKFITTHRCRSTVTTRNDIQSRAILLPIRKLLIQYFLVCHDRMSGLRVSSHQLNPGPVQQQQQRAAFRLSGDATIAQQVYLDRPTLDNSSFNNFPLLPPAEFGDGMASSMQPPSCGQLEDFSQKLPFGNPVVALSGQTRSSQVMTTNDGRNDIYAGYRRTAIPGTSTSDRACRFSPIIRYRGVIFHLSEKRTTSKVFIPMS